jgi:Domain of unknown function (DUF4349)
MIRNADSPVKAITAPPLRYLAIGGLVVAACLGGYLLALSHSSSPAIRSAAPATARYGVGAASNDFVRKTASAGPAVAGQAGQSRLPSAIIRTADLSVRVPRKRTHQAADSAAGVAGALGGYVLSSSFDRHSSDVNLVMRIPSQKFDGALKALRRLGIVKTESIHGEDVSLQMVDLGASLQNLEAQRTELLKLFERATSVAGTIKVQQVLSGVQSQIEQTKADLRYLSNRVTLATITLSIQSRHPVVLHQAPGRIGKAFIEAGTASLTVVAGTIVLVGYLLPIAILLVAVVGAYALLRRLVMSRDSEQAPEPAANS